MTTMNELVNQLPGLPQGLGVTRWLPLLLLIGAFWVLPVLADLAQIDSWRRGLGGPAASTMYQRTETSTSTVRRVVTRDRVSGTTIRTKKVTERCGSPGATADEVEACVRRVRRPR